MLEGLDKIDWASLDHAYGAATDVPDMLRELAAVQDEQSFREAVDRLAQSVHHQSGLYSSTLRVIPFLIEMLPTMLPAVRHQLVAWLRYMLRDCNRGIGVGRVVDARLEFYLDIYKAVSAGYPVYVSLPMADDYRLRLEVVRLIALFVERAPEVDARLVKWMGTEQNATVKGEIIYRLGKLLRSTYGYLPDYQALVAARKTTLNALLDSGEQPYVRLAVAVTLAHFNGILSPDPKVEAVLMDAIVHLVKSPDDNVDWVEGEDYFEDLHNLMTLLDEETLSKALAVADIQPETAHDVACKLLDMVFQRTSKDAHWAKYGDLKDQSRRIYAYQRDYAPFNAMEKLRQRQKDALSAVAACEPFWKLPTNLFSFFYGLPDSREELRRLIDES